MRVLILSSAWDTGGQGVRLAQAFADEPGWNVRSMSKSAAYFSYPVDLPYRWRALEEEYQAADVVHVRNHFADYDRLAKLYGPKPVVIHAHGSKARGDPNAWVREAKKRNALMVVSTLDLWLLMPEAEWLPSPYDPDELMAIRERAH